MTNNDYWQVISKRHQIKVRTLAEKHQVSAERAFRNIVNHLKHEMTQFRESGQSPRLLSGKLIEETIDLIAR